MNLHYATNLNEIHPYLWHWGLTRSQVDGGRDVHGCLGGDLVLFHVQAGDQRNHDVGTT